MLQKKKIPCPKNTCHDLGSFLKVGLLWSLSGAWVSDWIGRILFWERPQWVVQLGLYLYFRRFLKVNVDEAELPLKQYRSIGAFFVRRLRADCRPISPSPRSLMAPVDGTITQLGILSKEATFSVKGHTYSPETLGIPDMFSQYIGGSYLIVYLSPRDYHGVHHPLHAEICRITHIPGRRLPVNDFSLRHFSKVYAQNKRVILHYRSGALLWQMILVGALNVGDIRLHDHAAFYKEAPWRAGLLTPHLHRPFQEYVYMPPLRVQRGGLCATFCLGSTVLLLFPRGMVRLRGDLRASSPVRWGMQVGTWLSV